MEAREFPKPRPEPFQLSLRIRHPSMDPADITRELRLKPEHSFKAGEPRRSTSGIAVTSCHAESYWLGTLDPANWARMAGLDFPVGRASSERVRDFAAEYLGMALTLCTMQFLRAHADFLRRVQADGGQASLLVELESGTLSGFTITPMIGRALSDLGLSIDFALTA